MKKREIRSLVNTKKKAQVWVETVIYTLIGLSIIGLLLAVSKPQLDKQRDKALIEQAIGGLGVIDSKITEVLGGTGNKRKLDLKIGKGEIEIDAGNDQLSWIVESSYEYSQEDVEVSLGKITILTKAASPYTVRLTINYPLDIQYENTQALKTIGQSATLNTITVENVGTQNGNTVINIGEL
ncbi:MAG: type II secretory pathway pseudopilin PulG [Patescibacteria group bacterium]|jgi:type II secretory pathway pseudopilin PulG